MIKNLITTVIFASMPAVATTQNITRTYAIDKNINVEWYSEDGGDQDLRRITTESGFNGDDYGLLQYKAVEFYHGKYDDLQQGNVVDIENYTFYNKISMYRYTPYNKNGYKQTNAITLTETFIHPNMNMSGDLLLQYNNEVWYITDNTWDEFLNVRNNEITWETYNRFLTKIDRDLYKYKADQKEETKEVNDWENYSYNLPINTTKKYYATIVLERFITDETETTKPVFTNKPVMETTNSIQAILQFNISENQTIVKQEVIDLPSLIFTILSMPFSFISQAFNLTLFPNTPYSIDIGNIFLALIGTLILIFVIGLIAKKAK